MRTHSNNTGSGESLHAKMQVAGRVRTAKQACPAPWKRTSSAAVAFCVLALLSRTAIGQPEPEQFVLDAAGQAALASGISSFGAEAELTAKLLQCESKGSIALSVLGGSITAGHTVGGDNWFNLFVAWLGQALAARGTAVSGSNHGMHGCSPSYAEKCVLSKVAADADVVFLEFAVTDWDYTGPMDTGERRAFERLIRQLRLRPAAPVIIAIMFHPLDASHSLFYGTTEDKQAIIAQYYRVPVLSGRAAFFQMYSSNLTLRNRFFAYPDLRHPDHTGHHWHAELVKHFFTQSIARLAAAPGSPPQSPECGAAARPPHAAELPPPMLPGNTEQMSGLCMLGDEFKAMVHDAKGFAWVHPPGRLPGYEGLRPGDELDIHIELPQGVLAGMNGGPLRLLINFLVSYMHMGQAGVNCMRPCKCKPTTIDAHIEDKVSVPRYLMMQVDMRGQTLCTINVKISRSSKSGEHKFKLFGIATEYGDIDETQFNWYNFVSSVHSGDQGSQAA